MWKRVAARNGLGGGRGSVNAGPGFPLRRGRQGQAALPAHFFVRRAACSVHPAFRAIHPRRARVRWHAARVAEGTAVKAGRLY